MAETPDKPSGTPSRLGTFAGRLRAKAKALAERAEVAMGAGGDASDDAMAEKSMPPSSLGMPPAQVPTSVDDSLGISVQPTPRHRSDSDVLGSLDAQFYSGEFDVVSYILESIPDVFDTEALDARIREDDGVLDVLNARLSERVIKSYGAFVQAMARVRDLGHNLTLTAILCKNGRRFLSGANDELTSHPLDIVRKQRKKELLSRVVDTLEAIRGISETESRLKEAIESGNFPLAIQLCLQCRDAIGKFGEFHCVHEMSGSIQETYGVIESRLDSALCGLTVSFDAAHYEPALAAYKLLGKTFVVMEKLQEYFLQTLKSTTRQSVLSFVIRSDATDSIRAHHMLYRELCHAVPDTGYIPCLFAVLAGCCDVLWTHHSFVMWHDASRRDAAGRGAQEDKFLADVSAGLARFRAPLWDDMQQKVSVVLTQPDLTALPVEDVIIVYTAVERFIAIGAEFCGSDARQLHSALRSLGSAYFRSYHVERVDDVLTMLENEVWRPMPVAPGFSLDDIIEIDVPSRDPSPTSYFDGQMARNPFRGPLPESPSKKSKVPDVDVPSAGSVVDDDDDVDDALRAEFIDEDHPRGRAPPPPPPRARKPSHPAVSGPIVASATINTLRLMGKYVQMMKPLAAIADNLFTGLTRLHDLYFVSVLAAFGSAQPGAVPDSDSELPPALGAVVERWRRGNGDGEARVAGVPDMLMLDDPVALYGLRERACAVESMRFVVDVLEGTKAVVEAAVPESAQFYAQCGDAVNDLRSLVYRLVAQRSVNMDPFVGMIAGVNWATREVGTQHSGFVDSMLRDFQKFAQRLSEVCQGYPDAVAQGVWRHVIGNAMAHVLEGLAQCRKCSNEGRAQMSLDLKTLQMGLERLTTLRPIPQTVVVDGYIKAFYLSDDELVPWFQAHPEYQLSQVVRLVNCGIGTTMKKKSRGELLHSLEEVDRSRQHRVVLAFDDVSTVH